MEVQDPDYPSKKPRLYNVLNDISDKTSDSNFPIAGCSTYNASLDDKKLILESEDFYKSPLVPIASDENMYLWQQRQVAKAIVENTINNVLESYLSHSGLENRMPDLGLEESAILMAISEHGLQHTTQIPHDIFADEEDVERNELFYLNDVQMDSVDFMEAAVGAAIQKKGLTPSAPSASTEPSTSTAQR